MARPERCTTGTEDRQRRGCAQRSTETGDQCSQLFEEELSGALPPPLVEHHTLEHADDICPFVQILDAPVPQMVDNLIAEDFSQNGNFYHEDDETVWMSLDMGQWKPWPDSGGASDSVSSSVGSCSLTRCLEICGAMTSC